MTNTAPTNEIPPDGFIDKGNGSFIRKGGSFDTSAPTNDSVKDSIIRAGIPNESNVVAVSVQGHLMVSIKEFEEMERQGVLMQVKEIVEAEQALRERLCREVEGLKLIPTKHDGCTLDDSWCYNHSESMEEGTEPNGARYINRIVDDALKIIRGVSRGNE